VVCCVVLCSSVGRATYRHDVLGAGGVLDGTRADHESTHLSLEEVVVHPIERHHAPCVIALLLLSLRECL